MKMRK